MQLPSQNIDNCDLDNSIEGSESASDYGTSSDIDLTPEFIETPGISSQNGFVDYEDFVYNQNTFLSTFQEESTANANHTISGDVLKLVLQHLNYRDIKESSMVAKHWYKTIASSENCMNKLKLVVDIYCNDDHEEFLGLFASQRQYSDVKLVCNNNKHTMIIMEAILIKFSKFLVNLKIIKNGGHLNFLKKKISFDKLETIELFSVCSTLSINFLEDVTTLKTIVIDGIEPLAVKDLLRGNFDVQDLILYENAFITYLNMNLSTIYMNLRSFALFDHVNSGLTLKGEFPACEWSASSRERLQTFLLYQSPTLHTLRLDKCHAQDLQNFIKTLPHLRNLEVNRIVGDMENFQIPKNMSIKSFIAMNIDDIFLKKLVENLKGLKSIYLYYVEQSQLLWILR